MKKYVIILMLFILTMYSCSESSNGYFDSIQLISSQRERLYINSFTWGLTADKQRTIITKQKERLKNGDDTAGTVEGLGPFIFSFQNDTLCLFFNGIITYQVKEHFNSIYIKYITLNNPEYMRLSKDAVKNENFFLVPQARKSSNEVPKP